MAAPVRGHDHSIARVPRKKAVVHTREGCDGQRSGVTAVVLRWVGLRVDVLHLQFLLPAAGLLRGQMPAESAPATTAGRQPTKPAHPGGTSRSPRPPAGLPGTPPARDGSYFPRQGPIGQHRGASEGNGSQASTPLAEELPKSNRFPQGRGLSGSQGAQGRHPARLHPVRAWPGLPCGREEDRPREAEMRKKS